MLSRKDVAYEDDRIHVKVEKLIILLSWDLFLKFLECLCKKFLTSTVLNN